MEVRDMVRVGLFASLTGLGALITIDIGEVPITLQTIFVVLSGIILGPKLGAWSQLVYLLMGLLGLPVFSSGSGGIQSILRPSFGFIIGFIPSAYMAGTIFLRLKRTRLNLLISIFLAKLTSYIIGLPYMYFIINNYIGRQIGFRDVIDLGVLPFIPGALIKLAIIYIIAIKIYALKRQNNISF